MVEIHSERFLAGKLLHDPSLASRLLADGVNEDSFEERTYSSIVKLAIELVSDNIASPEIMRAKCGLTPQQLQPILLESFTDSKDLFDYHLRNIRDAATARKVYNLLESGLGDLAKAKLRDKDGVVDQLLADIIGIRSKSDVMVRNASELADMFLDDLTNRKKVSRVMTGFMPVDSIILGLMNARVTVVAGHTNHGKSLFSDHLALNIAAGFKARGVQKQVVKFSCEDDHDANALRFTITCTSRNGHEVGVDARRVLEHMEGQIDLTPSELDRINQAAEYLGQLNITVDGHSSPDRGYVLSRLMAAAAEMPIGLIIFDYLEFTGEQAPTKTQAIDQTMVMLHEMAKRFNCPVIAVSQLKESAAERDGGHPTLADLSWSGFIKKIAATVIIVHSPWEHWNQMGRRTEEPPESEYFIHIRKNKGDIGTAILSLHKRKLRISSDPPQDGAVF